MTRESMNLTSRRPMEKKKRKIGFSVENALFITGWSVFFCALFAGVFLGLWLSADFGGALRGGLLAGGGIIFFGWYLGGVALGIRKIIKQNEEIIAGFRE